MPVYEYECLCCQNVFDVEQSIKSESIATCPRCLVSTKKRLISRSSFSLKGEGWASDNYSSKTSSTTS